MKVLVIVRYKKNNIPQGKGWVLFKSAVRAQAFINVGSVEIIEVLVQGNG